MKSCMLVELSERERIVLEEREHGMTLADIAREHNAPQGMVARILKRAHRKLALGEHLRRIGFVVTEVVR